MRSHLENEVKRLEGEIEELWKVVSRVPELRKKLEDLYIRLETTKRKVSQRTPIY